MKYFIQDSPLCCFIKESEYPKVSCIYALTNVTHDMHIIIQNNMKQTLRKLLDA